MACPPKDTSIGYELLENGYFYVIGSNHTSELFTLGNQTYPTEMLLYIGNHSNQGFTIGVTNPEDPTFYIQHKSEDRPAPPFYIQGSTGNIGIGTSQPSYNVDIWGDMRVTGSLTQYNAGSNVVFVTQVISSSTNQVDFLTSGSNTYIDVSDTPLCNIQSLQVNDKLSIGGPMVQQMGNVQTWTTSIGDVPYDTVGPNRLGFQISWPPTTSSLPVLDATARFYAWGDVDTETRLSTHESQMLFPSTMTKIMTYKDTMIHSQTVAEPARLILESAGPSLSNTMTLAMEWKMKVPMPHTANLYMELRTPVSLGDLQWTPYTHRA